MLTYIHRVGRTGRAERNGTALTLFTDEDKPVVRSLANLLKVSGCSVPEWICELPKANKKELKKR
jgi:ATP-dependent RNA helicase DDX52/ROK1